MMKDNYEILKSINAFTHSPEGLGNIKNTAIVKVMFCFRHNPALIKDKLKWNSGILNSYEL